MKKKIINFILLLISIGILILLFYFFKNIIFDIIKYAKENNEEAIRKVLTDHGIFGMITVCIVEALQMVVVFLPAEFIQLAAGISYPPLIAILLCDLGVFLGASIIYLLVNVLNYDFALLSKSSKRINEISKKKSKGRGTQSLMYVLFILPIVPFGAICYFGSSSKMSYRRYILTCVTGVIPSIFSSILMGNLFVYFASIGISIWVIILIILAIGLTLLIIASLFVRKIYFKENIGSPNARLYPLLLRIFGYIVRRKSVYRYDNELIRNEKGPVVLLSNHSSYFDFYFVAKFIYPKRAAIVGNRYYFRNKIIRKLLNCIGVIPKKLFNPDIETIKKIISSVKDGHSIMLFPEGRLSIDGSNYNIVDGTGALLKKLNIPVYVLNIHGAYLANPKWRKRRYRSVVYTNVSHVFSVEDLKEKTSIEIDQIINEKIKINDFDFAKDNQLLYHQKNKAKGLDKLIYCCPKCHKEYSFVSKKNSLICSSCGQTFDIDINYNFYPNDLEINNIFELYQWLTKYEVEKIINQEINLSCSVKVERKNMKNPKLDKKGYGICKLNNKYFSFDGIVGKEEVKFDIEIKNLKALAYSVDEEFECYYNDDLFYFYPKTNSRQCAKWSLIVDELYKMEQNNE